MFDLGPTPIPDSELEVVLTEALRSGGGEITRPMACWMATIVARKLAECLHQEGLHVVRYPGARLT